MLDKLNSVEANYEELTALLATPSVQSDSNEYRKHAKALAEIEPLVEKAREYKSVLKEIEQAEELVKTGDTDMRELAEEELDGLKERRDALVADIKILLVPKDPNDAPGPAARRRRCSPTSSSGCTPSSRRSRVGASM
jgi:peptide chain release factor 1